LKSLSTKDYNDQVQYTKGYNDQVQYTKDYNDQVQHTKDYNDQVQYTKAQAQLRRMVTKHRKEFWDKKYLEI
jgi:hypothetical protein